MALKTGTSHSLATLFLTLVSALLIHFLRDIGLFEGIFEWLLKASYSFSQWLEQSLSIRITHELFPIIFVAAILAFIWGIIFHLARK